MPVLTPGVQQLLAFKDSDVKFHLSDLMEILRDRRHEGWVLAAYPDPKTGRPLIGAGFSLDLPERQHPQNDPLNPHPFVEPSSAQLWQAAGLDPVRLQRILEQYDENLAAWKKKRYRRKISLLAPQITDEEATLLLRIAVIQSIENARAYCRHFDQLTASQQMALSQLVYQMGVNLQEFDRFLTLMNRASAAEPSPAGPAPLGPAASGLSPINAALDSPAAISPAAISPASSGDALSSPVPADSDYWNTVQHTLIQSQWARLYRTRAISVIAMLDPQYTDDPATAEQRIAATLRPPVSHRHRRHAATLRSAAYTRHARRAAHGRSARLRNKRRA